jgi:hypothetical protein
LALTLTIPFEIESAAKKMASATGTTPERLLLDALRAHFPPLPEELQAEFDAWELASDQDMAALQDEEHLY